jgi:hypothetical protein
VVGLDLQGPRPLWSAEWIAGPVCMHVEAVREVLWLEPLARPARVVVRVYAAQRKPVASGRGASGLAGRPSGGSSSLQALGATSLGASA